MTDRELIEMAYKAMDSVNDHSSGGGLYRGCFDEELHHLKKRLLQKNFVSPPQREWQGLTDEEYEAMAEQYVTNCYFDTLEYAKAIEAKLKEKNT
jgi:hypothetical protein